MKLSTTVRQVFTRTIPYGDKLAVVACIAEFNPSTGEWVQVSESRIIKIISSQPEKVRSTVLSLSAPQVQIPVKTSTTPVLSWYAELFDGKSQSILSWFGARPPTCK